MSTPAEHSLPDEPGRALPAAPPDGAFAAAAPPGDPFAAAARGDAFAATLSAPDIAAAARGFWCHSTPALRDLGLQGDYVWVGLTEVPGASPALDLRGAIDGKMAGRALVPLDEILRMRAGFSEGDRRFYDVTIWRMGSKTALSLMPPLNNWGDFRNTMRVVARVMAAQVHDGGVGRIIGGTSKGEALILPVGFGLLTAATVGLSLFVLTNEPWYGRLIVPSVPVTLFVIFTMLCVKYQWPRPLRRPEELDRQLPPDPAQMSQSLWQRWRARRKTKG